EDGIRDFHVTGVQTCALPIFQVFGGYLVGNVASLLEAVDQYQCASAGQAGSNDVGARHGGQEAVNGCVYLVEVGGVGAQQYGLKIGRASCRERVEASTAAGGR